MNQRTAGLLGGTVVVAVAGATRIISAYENGGSAAAVEATIIFFVLVLGVVVGANLVQALVTRYRARTAAALRPDARVLLVGDVRHHEFGLSKAALLLDATGVELVALPDGQWSERVDLSGVVTVDTLRADTMVNWSTELEVTSEAGQGWLISPDGWRILPRFVLRARADRARDAILDRAPAR